MTTRKTKTAATSPAPVGQQALDEKGIDWVCDQIIEGKSMRLICRELKIGIASLARWIAGNPMREARVAAARQTSADAFAEKAETVLVEAKTKIEISRARELASHYRWMASKTNPKRFGERLEVEQHTTVTDLSDAELDAKLEKLEAKRREAEAPPDVAHAG